MPASTVTSKGQITLPKEIRETLGVRTGDRLSFRKRKDGSVVIEPLKIDAMELFGILKTRRRRPVSVDEMNEGIARHVASEWRRVGGR